jgi:hypothetical protein
MAETKKFGPYRGSKANGGRPIYVYKKKVGGKWVTTSKNKARADYESTNGKLPKDTDVDHKDNGGRKGHDGQNNLQAMSHSKNVAKEIVKDLIRKDSIQAELNICHDNI